MRPGPSPDAGFTLLELMVVVSISLIMAGLSAAALEPMVRRIRVSGAGDVVADALAFARAEALSTHRCVRVEVIEGEAGTPVHAPRLEGTIPGLALRVSRWDDANCTLGSASSWPGVTYVDTFGLPQGCQVAFESAADNPLTWLATGRVMGGLDVPLLVSSGIDPTMVATVTATHQGPICARPGGGGTCP